MTWQDLPCAPTLPALFAACPHGWAEIEFTYHAGNPTADPPQDADCSIGFGRVWGIDHEDLRGGPCRPAVLGHDVLLDLREPPLGMPHRDCTLLARVVHRAGPCNTCGRDGVDQPLHVGLPGAEQGEEGEALHGSGLHGGADQDGDPDRLHGQGRARGSGLGVVGDGERVLGEPVEEHAPRSAVEEAQPARRGCWRRSSRSRRATRTRRANRLGEVAWTRGGLISQEVAEYDTIENWARRGVLIPQVHATSPWGAPEARFSDKAGL